MGFTIVKHKKVMEDFAKDWKKKASQMATGGGSADEMERAFMELAYNKIAQKAGPLLKDPYMLGFEVLYSNEDNTKMAGAAAFRVGRQMLTIPIFFITGEVTGTVLLYQNGRKLFCPLDEEWADYMISKHYTEVSGEPVDPSVSNKIHPHMRLDRLAHPFLTKRAFWEDPSKEEIEERKAAWKEAFEEMEKHATALESLDMPGLLPFVLENAPGAFDKLAHALDTSFAFAEALVSLDEDRYILPVKDEEDSTKSAADEDTADIVIHTDRFPMVKSASEKEVERAFSIGYLIEDKRAEITPIFQEAEFAVMEVADIGFYDVVCSDSKVRKALVIPCYCGKDTAYTTNRIGYSSGADYRETKLIFEDGCMVEVHGLKPVGSPCEDYQLWTQDPILKDAPTSGSGYVAVNTLTGECSTPFYVHSITTPEKGRKMLNVSEQYCHEKTQIFLNEDLTGGNSHGHPTVYGSAYKFVKVDMEKSKHSESYRLRDKKEAYHPISLSQYWVALSKEGVKKVDVLKEEECCGERFKVVADDFKVDDVDDVNTTLKLAHQFGISTKDASEIVWEAAEKGSASFYLLDDLIVKRASTTVRLINTPYFQEDYNSQQAVPMQSPQQFVLGTQTSQPVPPIAKLGDGNDPTMGNTNRFASKEAQKAGFDDEFLLSAAPEELAQASQQEGIKNMVEPGVVGLLLSTYDSASLVAQYIPKLEEGLDHFGRILFLFYWKPADFEKLYGSDDMKNIENNLVSQFQSTGKIVLELIRKNENVLGSAPL
jgi:hypothetical protein